MQVRELKKIAKVYGFIVVEGSACYHICPMTAPTESRWTITETQLEGYSETSITKELATLASLETGNYATEDDDA